MKIYLWLTLLLTLIALLSGCGADVGDTPLSPTEAPGSRPPATSAPTATPLPTATPRPTDTPVPTATPPPTATPTPAVDPFLAALEEYGRFQILREALEKAELTNLSERGVLTLFAPTDAAFERLFESGAISLEELLADSATLERLLRFHLSPEPVQMGDLLQEAPGELGVPATRQVRTLLEDGPPLTLLASPEQLKAGNAPLVEPDIAVAAEGSLQVLEAVLTPVGLPATAPPDLNPDLEAWEPYEPGMPLPIGDAELVPGAAPIREAVVVFADALAQTGTQINIARAVRLEELGEITYLAPPAGDVTPDEVSSVGRLLALQQQPLILGVLFVDGQSELEPGPYLQVVTSGPQAEEVESDLALVLYAPGLEPVAVLDLYYEQMEPVTEIPVAAIFYGSKWCRHQNSLGVFCSRCSFWDWLTGTTSYDTQAICEGG